ncbi:hypothetical protein LSAT2_030303 [Lamellibrachia satsuma]|nr:hypothetical protein LSAT2_030303 [Lamellibrachia satsuma]
MVDQLLHPHRTTKSCLLRQGRPASASTQNHKVMSSQPGQASFCLHTEPQSHVFSGRAGQLLPPHRTTKSYLLRQGRPASASTQNHKVMSSRTGQASFCLHTEDVIRGASIEDLAQSFLSAVSQWLLRPQMTDSIHNTLGSTHKPLTILSLVSELHYQCAL